MINLAYLGDDPTLCIRNGSLALCVKSRGWRLVHLDALPAGDEWPHVLIVDTDFVSVVKNHPRASELPWIWYSRDPSNALKAWKMNADYFLVYKSEKADWEHALDRIAWRVQRMSSSTSDSNPGMHSLDLSLIKGRRLRIAAEDILYLEAQAEITSLYTRIPHHDKVVATRNLGYWESRLPAELFLRVHKKYIVNLSHVVGFENDALRLPGHTVPVAKRRIKITQNALLARGYELI
jgi:hypothetical protein